MAYCIVDGGFDVTFVDEVDDELKCVVCCLVLRDPIQLMHCGHRFCKGCLDKMQEYAVRLNTDLICPVDRELVDMQKVFADKGISRMVGNLRTLCCNPGCGHEVDLRELHKHEESCQFKMSVHGGESDPTPGPSVSLDDILKRLQSCEDNLVSKDEELLHLKSTVKELKDENSTIQQELQSVKELQQRQILKINKEMEFKILGVEGAVECIGTKTEDLLQKVNALERNRGVSDVDEEFICRFVETKTNEVLTRVVNDNGKKLLDPLVLTLRNDIEQLKEEIRKGVKETRATRSHLDKSLNKKTAEIKDLQHHVDNIENIAFAFSGPAPSNDIVLKWVLQDFKSAAELGDSIDSPIFKTMMNRYIFRLHIEFYREGTVFGIFKELRWKQDGLRILPEFSNPYTITVHGKEKGDFVTKYEITEPVGSYKPVGGGDDVLRAPYDNFLINGNLFITCTIHGQPFHRNSSNSSSFLNFLF